MVRYFSLTVRGAHHIQKVEPGNLNQLIGLPSTLLAWCQQTAVMIKGYKVVKLQYLVPNKSPFHPQVNSSMLNLRLPLQLHIPCRQQTHTLLGR